MLTNRNGGTSALLRSGKKRANISFCECMCVCTRPNRFWWDRTDWFGLERNEFSPCGGVDEKEENMHVYETLQYSWAAQNDTSRVKTATATILSIVQATEESLTMLYRLAFLSCVRGCDTNS